MRRTVYLTIAASSMLCFGVVAQADEPSVTLVLGDELPAAAGIPFPGATSAQAPALAQAPAAIVGELAASFRALAFRYASTGAAQVELYDGTEGGGQLLATFDLPATDAQEDAGWGERQCTFSGVARSFVIRACGGGVKLDRLRFDDVVDGPMPAAAGVLPG